MGWPPPTGHRRSGHNTEATIAFLAIPPRRPLSARLAPSPPKSSPALLPEVIDLGSLAAKSEGMKDSANLPSSRVREAPRAGTRKEARRNARSLPLLHPPPLALVLVSATTANTQPVGGIDRQATLFQGPASQPHAEGGPPLHRPVSQV